MKKIGYLILAFIYFPAKAEDKFWYNFFENNKHPLIQQIYEQAPKYHLQLIFTSIEQIKEKTKLQHHFFPAKNTPYLYPASLVKLPVALAVLSYLNEQKIPHQQLLTTILSYQSDVKCQKQLSSKQNLSVYNLIEKMLVVSDDAAFNLLFHLVGIDYINKTLQNWGFHDAFITHNFSSCSTNDLQKDGVFFFWEKQQISQKIMAKQNQYFSPKIPAIFIGKSHWQKGIQIQQAKNFAHNNFISLKQIHLLLLQLIFPNEKILKNRLNISIEQRKLILNYLSNNPAESSIENKENYPQNLTKYLYFGQNPTIKLPAKIKHYNIVGQSYGFMADVAYFENEEQKGLLSSAIYVNENQNINDGKYEYQSIGLPFMQFIGQKIINEELTINKK